MYKGILLINVAKKLIYSGMCQSVVTSGCWHVDEETEELDELVMSMSFTWTVRFWWPDEY